MKKIISVLGCGWLGKPLASYLITLGYTVLGSTRSESKLDDLVTAGIKPFVIDISNLSNSIQSFFESEILIVNITSKNVYDYQQLVDQLEKSPVKKVIFVSSTSVYKASNEVVSEETVPGEGRTLVEIENIFRRSLSFKTTVIRFAGLFGYTRKPGNFFSKGKILTDPYARVNMIHRDDCVSIIEKVIREDVWNEVFNACADSHPTKLDFYTKASIDIGGPLPTFSDRIESPYKIVSNSKVKQVLNFQFKHNDLLNLTGD